MKAFVIGTNHCNLDCAFCINKSVAPALPDLDKVIAAVEHILGSGKCEKIMISGGEPLADRAYLNRMLNSIEPYKERVSIDLYSNGHLLDDDTHLALLRHCRKLIYIFGVSPVPYKNLGLLLANPTVRRILKEDPQCIKINYVIPGPDEISSLTADIHRMEELGLYYQLTFNKELFKEAKSYYRQLHAEIRKTKFKPEKKYMCDAPLDCDMVTVESDGLTRGCGRKQTVEQLQYADLFLRSFCKKCKFRAYCVVCRPSLCRANFEQLCYLNYALCANLSEEELVI